MSDTCIIYSYDGYWGPNSGGYYPSPRDAGIYSREAAQQIAKGCGPEKGIDIQPVPADHPRVLEARIAKLEAALAAAKERAAALAAALEKYGPCPFCGGYGTESYQAGCDMEGNFVTAEGPCPCGGIDPYFILAAVRREAKREALRSLPPESPIIPLDIASSNYAAGWNKYHSEVRFALAALDAEEAPHA